MSRVMRIICRPNFLLRMIRVENECHLKRCLSTMDFARRSPVRCSFRPSDDQKVLFHQPVRNSMFGNFLDDAWNKVDENRVKEVGPELGAAEWIMRNGGSVKWSNHAKWVKDYNQLAMGAGPNTKIEAINATECSISSKGFEYLKGLSAVKSIKFHKAHNIDDAALSHLDYVGQTLTNLEITSCGNVTDTGLKGLKQLKNLKQITLRDLPSVKDPEGCVSSLKSNLPGCEVSYSS